MESSALEKILGDIILLQIIILVVLVFPNRPTLYLLYLNSFGFNYMGLLGIFIILASGVLGMAQSSERPPFYRINISKGSALLDETFCKIYKRDVFHKLKSTDQTCK
jgi:hypothetical protein